MTDDDLCFTPAHVLAELIRTRRLSPVELVGAVLARIRAHGPSVNAFALVLEESALAAARAAEAAVMAGGALGSLHGVPVTVKDLAPLAGAPTRRGSHTTTDEPAAADAPFTARLKAAGAIVIGKTTTTEFGWSALGTNPLTGTTHTPWRHGYHAGGSSSGAGAAAGAGFGPLHQGTDAAGSIRVPAHFCGVYGLKPTYGRVPMVPVGNHDYSAHSGPLARDVRDAAIMLKAMAGPHPEDHTSLEAPPADYPARLAAPLAGRRIAFSPDLGHARVDPEVAAGVRAAAGLFAELGADVEEVTPPWGAQGTELIRFFWAAHMTSFARHLPAHEQAMDPALVACIKEGAKLGVTDYQVHRERKLAYCSAIGRWFEDWDLLVTPTASVAAFPAERILPAGWPEHPWRWLDWAEFSYPFNFSGNPAASIPCGFTAEGLPVGVQVVGRRFDDLGVLQASAAFEQARPWAQARPPLAAA